MPTRLAWIGAAHIHTPGFAKEVLKREIDCAGVWDHDATRAATNADKLGGPVRDLADLALDPSVNGFIVCSETNRHLDLVKQLVCSGKPIYIEKPMGFNAEQSLAILELLESNKIAFQTGYFSRGGATYRELKRRVEAGLFGQITRIRASNCHGGALGGWFDTEWRWMADLSQSGVGAFGDLGTHVLDLLLWMFGPISAVTAAFSNGTARYDGCEEAGEALLKFENGIVGTLTASWDDVSNPIRLQVAGTEGHATLGTDLMFAGPDGKFEKVEIGDGVPAGFAAFLEYAGGASAELVTAREAANRDIVMDAIYRAAATQSWVDVIGV